MADALISPTVGGVMWAVAAASIGYSADKTKTDLDDVKIPLMGVLGAFTFAAQMINFAIPGTGSSGHLGGGMILAVLVGPYRGLLTMSSVLVIQALFFADGGLLALGCNIFNLAFLPCFIAFPLVYRSLVGKHPSGRRILLGSICAAVVGLQLGALGVVIQTVFSGITALPFRAFILFMQPIHLAIGIVEGIVTAAVVTFVWKGRPEILDHTSRRPAPGDLPVKWVLIGFLAAAAFTGGMLSWHASSRPDGLEWAIAQITGGKQPKVERGALHEVAEGVQESTALLPDYGYAPSPSEGPGGGEEASSERAGTSLAGLVGGGLTLLLAVMIGILFRRRKS